MLFLHHSWSPHFASPYRLADAHGSTTLPRLAGQYAAYVETQLKLFNQRQRTNDNAVMHAIVEKMTPLEMAAVAEFLSGK